jgi:rod shape-determining protein MreD
MIRDALVVLFTLLIAILLSIWTAELSGLPLLIDWVSLVLFYWVVALPTRVGLAYALLTGFTYDVLSASPLGHYALVMSLVCLFGQLICLRFRKMDALSQIALVFMLAGVARFVDVWLASFETQAATMTPPLVTALCSALVWPFVMQILRYFRRYHGLTEW